MAMFISALTGCLSGMFVCFCVCLFFGLFFVVVFVGILGLCCFLLVVNWLVGRTVDWWLAYLVALPGSASLGPSDFRGWLD